MTKAKKSIASLIANIIAIILCASLLTGSTFAWFTDEAESTGNIIASGALDVNAYWLEGTENPDTEQDNWIKFEDAPVFNCDNLEPGYVTAKHVKIANEGSLAFKYKMLIIPAPVLVDENALNLADVIDVYYMPVAKQLVNRADIEDGIFVGTLAELIADPDGAAYGILLPEGATANNANEVVGSVSVTIALKMKEGLGNEYQGLSVGSSFSIKILATQYAYEEDSFDNIYDENAAYPVLPDTWDGSADTSWYNDTDTEFSLSSSEQLAGLAELVDGGNTFEGKTIKLDGDMDLYLEDAATGERVSFDPIGYGYDVVFKGTFDGQGNTISNLYQNGWALGYDYSTEGGGLFASVVDATIKNVNIDGAEVVMECVDMGILVGYSYGNCTYENITVSNSTIANYQRYTGGVVGEVNGTQTFKNVDVADDVVVSSLWGDFDCSIGGIVGGKYGEATLTFEECDVACELNVYNDVTSSYQYYAYRRAGMLIGNSEETAQDEGRTIASASYLTASNCTVTYGKWANYTYCEFAGTNWPYVRVQAGYSNDAYSNPRYGVATDANGNKVVDDNHVHNDGEDHNIELAFDQLFGGGQGVYGGTTHNGVTVIYNNK